MRASQPTIAACFGAQAVAGEVYDGFAANRLHVVECAGPRQVTRELGDLRIASGCGKFPPSCARRKI